MIQLQKRLQAFIELGLQLKVRLENYEEDPSLNSVLLQAKVRNSWFTIPNQIRALAAIADMLNEKALSKWLQTYPTLQENAVSKKIGVIMAGNIPAVGFHDFLVVLLSGNTLVAKCATMDEVLIKWLADELIGIEPSFKEYVFFTHLMKGVDAVIATGSDNSARHFEYYFRNIKHIIRKNRNSVAVLTGQESAEDLYRLGDDIFSYFGLGCRNVSKLLVPQDYSFTHFFESIAPYGVSLNEHNKYLNNYDYYRAIYLLEQIPFLTNNFLHVKEDPNLSSPVSVLNYEKYSDNTHCKALLTANQDRLQCIVASEKLTGAEVRFGQTQVPEVSDFADGVDTLAFILNLPAMA